MVLEIVDITVKAGFEDAFEAGVAEAGAVFERARGCKGVDLLRSIENPRRYRLFVQWETLENHTVDFRNSPDHHEWRRLYGQYFDGTPSVEHVEHVLKGF